MKHALLISAIFVTGLSCSILSTDFKINEATTFCSADADCASLPHRTCDVGANLCRTCEPGFSDCNGEVADGCEVNLATDAAHCGACGTPCELAQATATCEAGACKVGQCADGYADCDGDALNGCEVDLRSDPQHCGSCSQACMPSADVKQLACAAGSCMVDKCAQGHTDCNGVYVDGCETATATDVSNCGSCGVTCSSLNTTGVSCGEGVCFPQCKAGFGSCGPKKNGCEVKLATDAAHCGACGNACGPPPNATAACVVGQCGIGNCSAGFANCDMDATDGCEVELATDSANCGICGKTCGMGQVCVASACAACPSGTFATFAAKVDYATGAYPTGVAVGDFNADGKPDLAVANRSANIVSVLLGSGNGTFAAKVDYATGSNPRAVAVGDFNADGKPDLAVSNYNANTVSVLVNNGNGTFAAKVDYATGSFPWGVAVGDFNADGKPDLAVSNYNANTVSVLVNNGNGTFAAKVDYATGSFPWGVAVGDFNADGKPDLAVSNYNANTVSVLVNNGNGTFAAKVDYATGSFPWGVAVGDFNADGKPDLAVTRRTANTVSVLLGNGNGTFAAKVDYTTGTGPVGVAVGDFNADGKPDLAVTNYDANTVSVLLGNGNGTFAAKADYATGTGPANVAVGDFNADGKPDLAVTNFDAKTVSVLLNGCK